MRYIFLRALGGYKDRPKPVTIGFVDSGAVQFEGDSDVVAWDCNCKWSYPLPGRLLALLGSLLKFRHFGLLSQKVVAGSVCAMKRNVHIIVPQSKFKLLQGASDLTEYRVRFPTLRTTSGP